MVRTISVRDAESTIHVLLDTVSATREAVVVEREGQPIAVLVNPEDYARPASRDEANDWRTLDALAARNDDVDPDEVVADVTAIVEDVRQEFYEERQRAAARGR